VPSGAESPHHVDQPHSLRGSSDAAYTGAALRGSASGYSNIPGGSAAVYASQADPVTLECIEMTLQRLQQDMNSALARLQSLETLAQRQQVTGWSLPAVVSVYIL